jgi:PKD repeat protein
LNTDSTFYYETIDADGFSSIRQRMVFSITKPSANFKLPEQPFLLTPGKSNTYKFTDSSEDAVAWQWNFGNGFQSSQKNPRITFNEAGSFDVTLIAESHIGCKDTITQTFETAWRGATPQIASVEICKNSRVSLEDPALSEIVVYSDANATNEVFRGASFLSPPLVSDTSFYIRNEIAEYPSEVVEVRVKMIPIKSVMQVNNNIGIQGNSTIASATSLSKYATQVKWLIGEEAISTNETIDFDLMELRNKELKLISYSQSSCTDTLVFSNAPSELPDFDDVYTCANEPFTVKAKNSSDIFFFTDETLKEFLGKGPQIILERITTDSAVYAINVQNVTPSAPVRIPIYISEVDASFSMSTDTLNLAFQNSINFEGNSTTVSNWEWNFGGSQTFQGRIVTATFDAPGVYNISLQVEDYMGCAATEVRQLLVFNDPLLGNSEQLKKYFSIYPNPANQFIHLKGEGDFNYEMLKIIDPKGREYFRKQNDKLKQQVEVISTSELKNGAYFLVLKKGKSEASFMFVISR